ncbi:MAG: leucyl/phenylalanyl-tRNA--protein transferase [Deltaproteobacteria bacterium]|nr:leucyl/phenylalanyl-tRNA--protein transferase [Deltaproteobacteria bacterium]
MFLLPETDLPLVFPDDFNTTSEGLLALGGNLHPETLIDAYSKGIFPWCSQDDPLLWWHPNPRAVILPEELHISRKICRLIKKNCHKYNTPILSLHRDYTYVVTINNDFENVITSCAKAPRKRQKGTWITNEIKNAYCTLHTMGYAHSVEVWDQNKNLVGGMYGIAMGRIFFGESMFSLKPNTSKLALLWLCKKLEENKFLILDCQVESKHIMTLGARLIPRQKFMGYLVEGETFKKKPAACFVPSS